MERKHFLKNGLAAPGLAAIAPLAKACKKETNVIDTGSGSAVVPHLAPVRYLQRA
jgi:hypothetical protein